ncbi:MAG: tRNA lysidine(34) synthetase TilS [Akkermansiaceae bacterium]|nr:tRNA lysidine(34) synthetase TilS [Akkermansiaceae bacterium]NNM28619.1 tRNA lysidine(34) synthetase TilS [Akkermansiaceae bacterium]
MVELPEDFGLRRRYLLGISGGRDSVALLHVLREAGAANLVLCHLNHQLRGLFSSDDAAFVRQLAEAHHLPFEIARANVKRLAEEQQCSIETAARAARHEFFAVCAAKHKCNRVLLAHHADDDAETVLFNLLRGSAGLKGMQYESVVKAGRRKLTFVRPLLAVRRHEIDEYVREHGIPYRDDASNAEPVAVRNRIRHEALPLLEEIMDRDVVPAILRATDISHDDRECLDALLEVLDLLDPQGRLHLPKLRKLPETLQQRALHRYLAEKKIPDLSAALLERAVEIFDSGAAAKVNLPGGKHLHRRAGRIFVA